MAKDMVMHCEMIKSEDVIKEVKKGPENFFQVVKEFCNDVKTLTERMQDLYKANMILLGLAGIGVQCKVVTSEGKELADFSFGTVDMKKVDKDELQRETGVQKD